MESRWDSERGPAPRSGFASQRRLELAVTLLISGVLRLTEPRSGKAPEARQICRTPIHKMKKPRQGRRILGVGFLQRCRAYGAAEYLEGITVFSPTATRLQHSAQR